MPASTEMARRSRVSGRSLADGVHPLVDLAVQPRAGRLGAQDGEQDQQQDADVATEDIGQERPRARKNPTTAPAAAG
jgi:hypothetical protein